jgi:hypothetical protein
MARLWFTKNGDPYIRQGYVLLDERGLPETHFSTYHLYPRAERLLEIAGVEEGMKVPEEAFYALLVDGDLYNESRPQGARITAVPLIVRVRAEETAEGNLVHGLEHHFNLRKCQWTLDVYNAIVAGCGGEASQEVTLFLASSYTLSRYVKRHKGHEEERGGA